MAARLRITTKTPGKIFEDSIEGIFAAYKRAGIAKIEKVDPPVRVIGSKSFKKVIFLENPWLDYSGVWSANGGQQLHIEAKTTGDPRLEIGEKGISDDQVRALLEWHKFGAAVGIAWGHEGQVKVITVETIRVAVAMGLKSFKWRHLPPCPRGEGFILWDILRAIRETR